ncbi:MAG: hypothetical protein JXA21_07725 [Anaerolineae bacterium]|nr:hypothetical protein [Anaerolineae bacterium]
MSVVWQQRTHGIQRRKQQVGYMLTRVFFVVLVVVTTLAAAYLTLVASNVRIARQIWAMEQQVVAIQRENQALQVEITHFSSIPVLQKRSVSLGYQPAKSVDYISVGAP